MDTPHYLRFVRALALVAGAGCSDNATPAPTDAAPPPDTTLDVAADQSATDVTTDQSATDVAADTAPATDVAADTTPATDVAADTTPAKDVAADILLDIAPDLLADATTDLSPRLDVTAEDGGSVPDGAVSPDVVADANPCPPMAPRNGDDCTMAMTSCHYDLEGGGFTSCTCTDMGSVRTWRCATAVPGPLPPPEFVV